MEEDRKSKHMCKFCSKIFPCGRSLGGHMRSHLINISSTEKKLPPLSPTVDLLPDDGVAYGLRENPKKTRKFSDHHLHHHHTLIEDDGGGDEKLCHMKSHSKEDDTNAVSWQYSNDHHNKSINNNSSSENEAAPFCKRKKKKKKKKKKRSERTKRYSTTNSEQEEVAISLILLSMDYHTNSFSQSHNTASISDTRSSSSDQRKLFMIRNNGSETEVNSPKSLIKKEGPFQSDHTKKRKKNNNKLELSIDCKFKCIICNKAFASYQALGGHRASHKKFKGCCAPTPNVADDHDHNLEECKKVKEHECPICFKTFQSGQALGGHKRSHLIITDEAKNRGDAAVRSIERRIIVPEVRGFLDLNLPAPLEEDCNDFNSSSYSYLQFLAY